MERNFSVKKKTIGIIGTGKHFFKRIYPILKISKSFKITGILNRKNKIKNFKNFNEKDFFREKFDFIYIATPNKSHEKFIIKSLKNNSHVICEKPFLTRKKNIKKILTLSKSRKKLIFESFAYLYHPVFEFVKKQIKNKTYGSIKYVISNFRYPSLDAKDNKYKSQEGDGFYYDAATYLLSLENYLFEGKKDENIKFSSQKIRNKVDLRGNIYINSSKFKRFYFWGEGQNYSNSLEIFLSKATIYINKFFSKNDNEKIYIQIFTKNGKKIKIFKPIDQFKKMFEKIHKSYSKIKFQEHNRKKIKNQLDLLFFYKI